MVDGKGPTRGPICLLLYAVFIYLHLNAYGQQLYKARI